MKIQYHLGKANEVANALSRKTQHELNMMINTQPDILIDLKTMGIELLLPGSIDGLLSALEV